MPNQKEIDTPFRVNIMAPCEMVVARVKIAAPQTVLFNLGDATCDGCELQMRVKANTPLHLSVDTDDLKFYGRCIRKRGQNEVTIY